MFPIRIKQVILLLFVLTLFSFSVSAVNITTPTNTSNINIIEDYEYTPTTATYVNISATNGTSTTTYQFDANYTLDSTLWTLPHDTVSGYTYYNINRIVPYYQLIQYKGSSGCSSRYVDITYTYSDSTQSIQSNVLVNACNPGSGGPTTNTYINPYPNKILKQIYFFSSGHDPIETSAAYFYLNNSLLPNINFSYYNNTINVTVKNLDSLYNIINTTTNTYLVKYNSLLNITATPSTNFTARVTDMVTSTQTNYSTTTGLVTVDTIIGLSYNITMDAENSALNTTIKTVTQTFDYINFGLQGNNSIIITIVDEKTSALITENISILLQSNNTLDAYSTTNGYLNITNIYAKDYTLIFTSSNYTTRYYSVNIADRTSQELTARLLNNGNSTAIGIYLKNEVYQQVPDGLITIQRQYFGGSYATVAQSLTDDNGFSVIYLESGETYRVIISADGYITKTFNQQFYLANSPYQLIITTTGTSVYVNYLDSISYYIIPATGPLTNTSYNFGITTYNSTNTVAWTAVTAGGSTVNVSGSPTGGTASINKDLSNYTSGTYNVTYSFSVYDVNTGDYTTHLIPINYLIVTKNSYNTTVIESFTTFKTDIGNAGWEAILAVFIILAGVATIIQLSGNPTAGIMTGFGLLIFFGYTGWINPMLVVAIVFTSIMLMYIERQY